MDRKSVMSWLEGLAQDDWRMFHSDSEVQEIARSALAMIDTQYKLILELQNLISIGTKMMNRDEA